MFFNHAIFYLFYQVMQKFDIKTYMVLDNDRNINFVYPIHPSHNVIYQERLARRLEKLQQLHEKDTFSEIEPILKSCT